MRIWYLAQFGNPPGRGRGLRQFSLSRSMVKKGHDVTLFYGKRSKTDRIKFWKRSKSEVFDNVNCVLVNGTRSGNGITLSRKLSMISYEFFLLLSTLFKRKKNAPDVVIASSLSLFTILSGVILQKRYRSKLIVEIRDIHPESFILAGKLKDGTLGVKFLRWIERVGYSNANGIISTMPKFDMYMKKRYPNISFNYAHISQGYLEEFQIGEKYEFDLPKGFNVCYAGGMQVANKMELMVETAINLGENKNINFCFIGEGPQKAEMIEKTKDFDTITFLDAIPKSKLNDFLSKFDLLIMAWRDSAIYEYGISPNKMVDYLLSERPILVAYNGYKDILNEVDCGKYIETDNPQLFADTIVEFSKMDKSELDAMGNRGRKYAEENMNFDKLAEKLLQFIDKV